ncbi:MAG: hypothetical protein K2P99_06315 [Burkholderiales bacterium]|nr:hypothetical protein [Burkholderiales bacterium]
MKMSFNLNPKTIFTNIAKNDRIVILIEKLKEQSKPLVLRWLQFTTREKQLIITLLVAISGFFIFSLISWAFDVSNNLSEQYKTIQAYQISAQSIKNQYSTLSKITANQFSNIGLQRIKGDVTQALSINTPDVTLQDNLLIIKADNVLLQSAILLMEQLRKSYGIFPSKLKIIQSKSGHVNFKATFIVSE